MRKTLGIILAGFAVLSISATGFAAEYDRYERDYRPGSPGYREEPPPVRRAAAPPMQRHAQHGEPYFFAHLGVFDPNDDFDGLRGFDSGGAFDLGVGSRVSPVFAVDGTLGGYSADLGVSEVTVVPVTIGGRLIVPNPFIEPYLGAGLGLYFVSLEDPFLAINDETTEFGGYVSLGMDFWLNQRVALNFEGKYHWVDATFDTANPLVPELDVEVGGWTVLFGVRASF